MAVLHPAKGRGLEKAPVLKAKERSKMIRIGPFENEKLKFLFNYITYFTKVKNFDQIAVLVKCQ